MKISNHAHKRMKERCGFTKKSQERMAKKAFEQGITNAITEILRLGYESERGKSQVSDMIESIKYTLDDMERIINR